MIDDSEGVVIVETYEEEFQEHESGVRKGCMTTMAILLALIIVLSAAVPLTRFIIRRNYDRQVQQFPTVVCDTLSEEALPGLACDPSIGIIEFVPRTFPLGISKDYVANAMKGVPFEEQSALSQPGCQQPTLWTYLIAKSSLGWHTEVEFLFCSDKLVDRNVLLNGVPVRLPTNEV